MKTNPLPLYFLKLTLSFEEPPHFSEYPPFILRGSFGYHLRRAVCITRNEDCQDCIVFKTCPYTLIFNTTSFEPIRIFGSMNKLPHPLMLSPDFASIRSDDQETIVYMTLFGKSIPYLPYLLLTFENMGKYGMGKHKQRFEVIKTQYYAGDQQEWKTFDRIKPPENTMLFTPDETALSNPVTLHFYTPTNILSKKRTTKSLSFEVIIRALLRRYSLLSTVFQDTPLKLDFPSIIQASKEIQCIHSDLSFHYLVRYSRRQSDSIHMNGVIGSVKYEGDFSPFRELLTMGQYIGIGKHTIFGFGKYRINTDPSFLLKEMHENMLHNPDDYI